MVIDLRGRGRRVSAGLLLLLGGWLLVQGAGQVVRQVTAELRPAPVVIRRVARTEKLVALTFDAVWEGEEAEAVHAALLRHRLSATFFPAGPWLSSQGELIRKWAAEGFEFGNATESYPHLDALPPEVQREEVRRADARLTRLLGRKVTLFRPPHGESTDEALLTAHELGYRAVLWTVDALDGRNPPPEFIATRVAQHLSPGTIVRLTTAGRTTAAALPLLADLLARRGYRAVTLSELLLRENYYVDQGTGEQRPLPGSRSGERPVLSEWWERRRHGVRRGVTLAGRPMEGLLAPEVRREVEELARRGDRGAQPARWDEARRVVVPEQAGRRVDVEATLEAVFKAQAGAAVQPVVRNEAPAVVAGMFSPVYRGSPQGRRVALMFNVAWGNEVLPQLLATLRQERVKATFLVLGQWADRFPGFLREISRGGHPVGSHAYDHLDFRERSSADLKESLRRTEEAIRRAGVTPEFLFAPPSGAVSPAMTRTAAAAGYWTIMWTADAIDWQLPEPAVIQARVRRKVVPGALVLLHPTEPTVRALPGLLAHLRREGYTLVTVRDLLPP